MSVFKSVDRNAPQVAEKKVVRLFGGPADPVLAGERDRNLATAPRRNLEAPAEAVDLDMGMGSRIEGFKNCGHR